MSEVKTDLKARKDSEPQKVANPFPGLRPFSIEESHLFFGREGQSEEVLNHLSGNRFVAVIGASGSGKSSLMYCGLVPILYGGFIAKAGSEWKIITTRPGDHPIENLADSISKAEGSAAGEEYEVNRKITLAILRRSSMGLVQAINQLQIGQSENILLMVDQFEELFRFKKSRKDESSFNDSEAFVKLLVEAVRQTEIPVYIILTMRSDFIGDCSQFQELTELINQSNYLIPQMTRDDFRDAITGPVAVGGAQINPNLVQQLLNDVGDNPDQLPILQHALMRTWDYWMEQGDMFRPISLSDYNAVGRMEKALSEHANEAFDELSPKEKQICESMFKTLTEKGGDNIGIRQPTRMEVIAEIARADVEDLKNIIDIFRAPGRSFLTPAHHIGIKDSTIIDISHESLMRIWDRLKIWVDEEAQAVQMYNRLAEASALFQMGKTGLWRPPDLQLALNWRKKQQPTLTWAERYNPAFERAMVFLETSEKEFIAEEENKIRLQKRQLQRTRVFAMVLGSAAIVSIGLMLWSFVLRGQALSARNEAEYQRTVADSNATVATEQRLRAEQSAEEANRQRSIADSNATVAVYQKQLANSAAEVATYQRSVAQQNEKRANEQADIAEQRRQEADEQRQKAEDASAEAYRRRLLSIGQSMSVKSLQVDNDTNLKALLAYQAYLFNMNNGGKEHNSDIYAGLHSAMKFLNGASYYVYRGHEDAVRSLVFAPGTKDFYSTGSDGRILKWKLEDPEKQYSVIIDNDLVNRVIDVSQNGQWLACGTDGLGIQIFSIESNPGEPQYFEGHNNRIRTIDFLPDNRHMVSAGLDNEILLWNLNNGNKEVLTTVNSQINILVVSEDGLQMAGGTKDGKIMIWNMDDTENFYALYEETGNQVLALTFSKDGNVLVSGDMNGNVKVWDLTGRRMTNNLRGHTARITYVKYSLDNKILASASNDGTIRLWETADLNNQPILLSDNAGFVFAVAFSPDGNYLISGSMDENRLVLSPTKTSIMAEKICSKIERNFTRDEWNTYVGSDIEYEETCGRKINIGVKKN